MHDYDVDEALYHNFEIYGPWLNESDSWAAQILVYRERYETLQHSRVQTFIYLICN